MPMPLYDMANGHDVSHRVSPLADRMDVMLVTIKPNERLFSANAKCGGKPSPKVRV